jgi:pyroglutamyl-peptidase
VGLNWVQTHNADESGNRPIAGRILEGVDLALMCSFPIDRIFLELKRKQMPVEISFSAGTFVCNELYFRILNKFKNLKALFVHVPLLPEQVKPTDPKPSLAFEVQLDTLREIVRKCQSLFSVKASLNP